MQEVKIKNSGIWAIVFFLSLLGWGIEIQISKLTSSIDRNTAEVTRQADMLGQAAQIEAGYFYPPCTSADYKSTGKGSYENISGHTCFLTNFPN